MVSCEFLYLRKKQKHSTTWLNFLSTFLKLLFNQEGDIRRSLKYLFNLIELTTDLERRLWFVVIHFNPLHFHFRLCCWFFLYLYWLFHAICERYTRKYAEHRKVQLLSWHGKMLCVGNIWIYDSSIVEKNVYRKARAVTITCKHKNLRNKKKPFCTTLNFCWLNDVCLTFLYYFVEVWRHHHHLVTLSLVCFFLYFIFSLIIFYR
jgi:hypothetical protein